MLIEHSLMKTRVAITELDSVPGDSCQGLARVCTPLQALHQQAFCASSVARLLQQPSKRPIEHRPLLTDAFVLHTRRTQHIANIQRGP